MPLRGPKIRDVQHRPVPIPLVVLIGFVSSMYRVLWMLLMVVGYGRLGLVGKGEQELCQAALRRSVVAQDRRERGIAKWLRKTLAKSFASARVVGQPFYGVSGV